MPREVVGKRSSPASFQNLEYRTLLWWAITACDGFLEINAVHSKGIRFLWGGLVYY